MNKQLWWHRFKVWMRHYKIQRKVTIALIATSVFSGLASFATMTGGILPLGSRSEFVVTLLYLDVVLLLLLGVALSYPLVKIWIARRQGLAGSRLHIKLVVLFGLVAVSPAIVVAVFSSVFLNFGIQSWFSERVSAMLNDSRTVAQAYLHEHQKVIQAEILAMAADLNREAPLLINNKTQFRRYLETQAALRQMTEAAIIDQTGRILYRTQLAMSLDFGRIPLSAIKLADSGRIALLSRENDDRVRALLRLDRFVGAYLLVGRFVDSHVVSFIDRTEEAYQDYKYLEQRRKNLQVTFIALFVVLALLLLLAAIGIGLVLASSLVRPIGQLISAVEHIRKGDLTVRANIRGSDEMATLGRTFNRMAVQIETQQKGLLRANQKLDERRRFTETVLSGVSSGVVGLDAKGRIHLPNRSADALLGVKLSSHIGKPLIDLIPEFSGLLDQARMYPEHLKQTEILLKRNHRARIFLARICSEVQGKKVLGYVLTFDDITDLQNAQRQAAWADVARRIAHEIKNPLTPIQLSAERLKRKYLRQIEQDSQSFATCTETIIRQVKDIECMVDEFSAFARMPEPIMKSEDLCTICRDTIFLEQNRATKTVLKSDLPKKPVHLHCDRRQISQAITNVIKNATESISEHLASQSSASSPGIITLTIEDLRSQASDARILLCIEDNGKGLPATEREHLMEPYVTTRSIGSGLGLAIVKKIMEDHNGEIILKNRSEGGARVCLVFYGSSMNCPSQKIKKTSD